MKGLAMGRSIWLGLLLLATFCSCSRSKAEPRSREQFEALELVIPEQAPAIEVRVEKAYSLDFSITDMDFGRLRESDPAALVVVGYKEFVLMDPESTSLKVLRSGRFENPSNIQLPISRVGHVRDLNGDGILSLIRLGSSGGPPITGYDADGGIQWRAEGAGYPEYTLDFDATGDGRTEFLVGYERSTVMLDSEGSVLWRKERNFQNGAAVMRDSTAGCLIGLVSYRKLTLLDEAGEDIVSMSVPGAEDGYHNCVDIARNVPGYAYPLIVFGAFVDDNQYMAVWDPRQQTVMVADSETTDPFLNSVPLQGSQGNWLVKTEVIPKQAFPAGFESTKLRVQIFSDQGAFAFERFLSSEEVELEHALWIEDGAFLVGYGKHIWRFTHN